MPRSFDTASSGATSDPQLLGVTPEGTLHEVVAVGLSDPQFSQGRRRMLDVANRLHSTGVQLDIDLPVIAVIGSQSAGKSSLIESISGITLPRASGTCTRCPTECRLSFADEPWVCVVSLRFMTDEHGQMLGQVRNETFGEPIFEKSEVEERIRRAQRAILNPGRRPREFLDGDDEDPDTRELTFSKNCVCLQIKGPDVADLSFVDLPGLIASVGKGGRAGDIELVKSLVESYIEKPSCLILLTVACETDFENQGAHHLAKFHDPEGKRTIGVLTKPDRIPHGEEESWLQYIRNEREPLMNGWFSVKQPDSKAIKAGISWAEARNAEDDFFSMTAPWSSLDYGYQSQLRTSNLIGRLSDILSELISKRLPEIQTELQTILQRTEESLRHLPKPPSNDPIAEIHGLLHSFTRELSRHIEGTSDGEGLIQKINAEKTKFRLDIRATAPDFRPYERNTEDPPELPTPAFLNDEEPDGFQSGLGKEIYLDEVMQRVRSAVTRELPDHYPFVVVKQLILSVTRDQWEAPSRNFLDMVHMKLVAFVKKIVSDHFSSFSAGVLQQRITIIVIDHIKECFDRAQDRLMWLLELEDAPSTLNTHYYASYKDKFLAYYRASRQKDANSTLLFSLESFATNPQSAPDNIKIGVNQVFSGLGEIGLHGVGSATDLAKLLPSDTMEIALNIMAEVRAYYQVAYKRFADNIPLAVDRELVRGLDDGIGKALFKGLGLGGDNGPRHCKELLQEPASIVTRREELNKKRERLRKAKQELMELFL